MIIFNKAEFHADYLAQMGISEEEYFLLNSIERGQLDDAAEAERLALVRDWEQSLGEDW